MIALASDRSLKWSKLGAKTLPQVEFYIWTASKTIRSTFLWMNPSPVVSSAIYSDTYQARPQVNRSKIG